jgi:aminoglycoside phosphotransferase (APT) family kinase protein
LWASAALADVPSNESSAPAPEGIHAHRVDAWLTANIDGAAPPFRHQLIAGGRSNLTYRVTAANGVDFVLRRPPLGQVLATAHDMVREHRIVTAVGSSSVPVPRTLGMCDDAEVTGAPFYVMTHVDGDVLDSPEKARLLGPDQRIAASEHLIDVLADLHAVDVDAIGLGDLARRDGYIERQVRRWSTQWDHSKTRELPAVDEVGRLLAQRIPPQRGVSIAHGDYRFGNCLVDPSTGRVAAVLDWELCTLGDPLADVGYLGVYWHDASDPATARANDPTPAGGFVPYPELLERYASATGRDLSHIGFYVAFSCWRLAVISEGVHNRYLHGAMGDHEADLEMMKAATNALAERALAALKELV